ncbi:hypothetical protein HCJ80_12905 [Listeria grayi]|nr:hypothetical protein [Listeria grayi]
MKAGDILIVYGTRITPRYIGHAAIATSSKYVMEMTGPKHKSEHNTKAAFFKRNTTGSKYVLVYRIKKHPHYADDASTYAYKHMYKKDRIQKYYISPRLYHKDPSYCSKFVYLSYYWGATKSSVKYLTEIHIVTPHALIGDFKGTFKPSKIHKITKY